MSAIPWIGQDIVEFIWGGFSVNNATLNRFFALHFVLPFILAALALMHLISLHDSAGSSNPLGLAGNYDRLPFSPYFIFKDLITIFLFILVLSVFVFFMPNVLGDSENYVMANPMQTPPAIVPEWYLLPFYAILRSIPNKLLGVIAMFSAILILLAMPFTDISLSRGIQFKPLNKIAFFIFTGNFLILMQLGAKHVESPFIEFGQISTVIYFAHFLIIIPLASLFENSVIELSRDKKDTIFLSSKETESDLTAQYDGPAKSLPFLNAPLFSGIAFNSERFWSNCKKKFTITNTVSLMAGITAAWVLRSYLISKGLNLNVFLDFSFTTATASWLSFIVKELMREYLVSYAFSTGAGDAYTPNLGNVSYTLGNNPEGNSGGPSGNNREDPNNPVANTQEYVSTGPDTYLKEKKELARLCGHWHPRGKETPMEEALSLHCFPEPAEYLKDNFPLERVKRNKEDKWLEKVKDYFDAIDSGKQPSPEAISAFEKRKERYIGHTKEDNWKGAWIDFNNPANVRKVALEDLEQHKAYTALEQKVTKAFENQEFTGPDAKKIFFDQLNKLWGEHKSDFDQYYRDDAKKEMEKYHSYDKKTLFGLLEYMANHRKAHFQKVFQEWIQVEQNRDLFNKWSEDKSDKAHQEFIKKWELNDKNT